MKREQKTCQNCKKDFTIEPDDFAFYEKIQVPPPTWCPECRFQRRLAWRNLSKLYRRPCDLCKKESFSLFPAAAPYTMYCTKCWWSDDWDPMRYGREYDFSKPFFKQFDELLHTVPLMGLSYDYPNNINSPYVNDCGPMKNSYLMFYGEECENAMVGFYHVKTRDILDSSLQMYSEWCYDSRNGFREYRAIGLENTNETIDSFFLRDCKNCQNCFASANIKNKKYHIFNEPYSREEYFKKIKSWDIGSYAAYQEVKRLAREHWKKYPPRPIWLDMSVGTTGNYAFECKNCKECYEVIGVEDGKYLFMLLKGPIKNCMDISAWGNDMELCYECCVTGEHTSRMLFCQESGINCFDTEYCKQLLSSSHAFGCVSVRKKQHCILNKQYSKEEYETLVPRIRTHMNAMPYVDQRGRSYAYGEFFPVEISPHGYHETFAQDFFPLTEEKARQEGYKWQVPETRAYAITKQAADLPDHIRDADESVLKEVIQCATCQRGYKITPMELGFLKQMNVPLPRRCPFCRIDEKFQEWIKQMRLVDRVCDTCKKSFRTPYPADEYPHILCKPCWTEEFS